MRLKRSNLKQIEHWLGKPKVLIIYGARQVGKTTILKILRDRHEHMIILSAEQPSVQEALGSKDLDRIKFLIGDAKIVAIDEAQKIEDIGEILKYIHDAEIGVQWIATGSSSFDLSNKITEPLTGRNIKFTIYPYALTELIDNYSSSWVVEHIDRLLIYGQYPEIVGSKAVDTVALLQNLTSDFLYQDILQQERLKNSNDLRRILKALAFQIGNEVSYHEIAQLLGLAPQTIERYIDLLEKNFIIYTLPSFSRNLRNELKKSKKMFFWDLGIRNAIISNFAAMDNRMDVGGLWENFCINERRKNNDLKQRQVNYYFWRTYDQAEIDLIEESNGNLEIFEFKYNPKKAKARFPKSFMSTYEVKNQEVIDKGNFYKLIN